MKGQFYKAKRHKLLEKVKDNSVIVLFAGNAPKKTADEAYPFTPNRNFYYLTGVQEPDHILLMSKINGKEKNILFIKDIDLELEKWIGKSLRENEALDIAGVDEVMFKSTFEDYFHRLISMKEDEIPISWYYGMDEQGRIKNMGFDEQNAVENRQSNRTYYIPNGAIYILDTKLLRERHTYYSDNTVAYLMPQEKSVDIDCEFDFKMAELLLSQN